MFQIIIKWVIDINVYSNMYIYMYNDMICISLGPIIANTLQQRKTNCTNNQKVTTERVFIKVSCKVLEIVT